MIFPFKSKRVRELEASLANEKRLHDNLYSTATETESARRALEQEAKHLQVSLHAAKEEIELLTHNREELHSEVRELKKGLDAAGDDVHRLKALVEEKTSGAEDHRRMSGKHKEDADAKALTLRDVRSGLINLLSFIEPSPAIPMPLGLPPNVTDVSEGVRGLVEDLVEQMELDTDMEASCQCPNGMPPCSGCVDGHVFRKKLIERARNFLSASK